MRPTARRLLPYLMRYRRGLALGLGSLILKDLAAATGATCIDRTNK